MPTKLSKTKALELLTKERKESTQCLICEIIPIHEHILYEDKEVVVFLSKYPRFWGHTIVTSKKHFVKFSEIPIDIYKSCFSIAKDYAVQIEKTLQPIHTYISALGSSENLLNTCPHFHIHVLPIFEKNIKPSEIFTWENGIYQGSSEEWTELKSRLNNTRSENKTSK